MIRDTRPQDGTGVYTVGLIVQGKARHGWQEFSARNDNGVDGIIIKRKNGRDTGEVIYVQIKCGSGSGYFKETKNRPAHFGVQVGEEYISSHRVKWNNLFGPIILVYVDYHSNMAWWTDLKDDQSFTDENKSIILVPKSQRFGEHSFGSFNKLKGFLHINPEIQEVTLSAPDVNYLSMGRESLKNSAKRFYSEWALSNERDNPALGEIIISREGWRHITRTGRKKERIIQSWQLLGAAKRIIQSVSNVYQLRHYEAKGVNLENRIIVDYISLRAQVMFPNRHSGVVQVVLIRKRKINPSNTLLESKIRFLSVYEPMKGRILR